MSSAMSVARREFAAYFNSPVAYVVLSFYLIVAGALFFFTLLGPGVFVAGNASMRAFFEFSPWLLMVVVPAVTMRLIAEELKSGTLEVLMTLPITETQVVVGKYLGAMGMLVVGLLCTLPIPIVLSGVVADGFSFDWGTTVAGYAGLVLLSSAYVGIGIWISALTRNQIVAFIVAFLICLVLNLLRYVTNFFPEGIGGVLQYASTFTHFENIARGVIDSRDVVYYLTVTVAGLALCAHSLREARK